MMNVIQFVYENHWPPPHHFTSVLHLIHAFTSSSSNQNVATLLCTQAIMYVVWVSLVLYLTMYCTSVKSTNTMGPLWNVKSKPIFFGENGETDEPATLLNAQPRWFINRARILGNIVITAELLFSAKIYTNTNHEWEGAVISEVRPLLRRILCTIQLGGQE